MNNIVGKDGIGQILFSFQFNGSNYAAFLYDDGVWIKINPDEKHSLYANNLNDLGQLCGKRQTEDGWVGFRWQDGKFTDFDPPFGISLTAIDNVGTIFGVATPGVIFTWNDGVLTLFEQLARESDSEWPTYVNVLGQIAGDIYLPPDEGQYLDYSMQGFYLDVEGATFFEVDGFSFTQVFGMNDVSQVLLMAWFNDGVDFGSDALLWQDGKYSLISSLYDPPPGTPYFQPRAMNNLGQMTSSTTLANGVAGSNDQSVCAILTPIDRPLGDINIDCAVDGFDLARVLGDWGPCNEVGVCVSDIVSGATFQPPGDGIVDAADLAVVLGNWDTP